MNHRLNIIVYVLWLIFCPLYSWAEDTAPKDVGSTKEALNPEGAGDKNYFDVMEYRVEGNTLLPKGKIEEAVYPFLGEHKTLEDVQKAQESLQKAYSDAGYGATLVDIPEQDTGSGVVALTVTESKVGKLRVLGSKHYSLGRIRSLAPSVAEGAIPHFPSVQKDMEVLNRAPDKRVTPVLRPGKDFGTVDVDLKVDDSSPFHASVEINDQYSRDTTRWRVQTSLRYNNLWQRDHSLRIDLMTSPENTDEVKLFGANYIAPLENVSEALSFVLIKSDSNVKLTSVGGTNVAGKGVILGVIFAAKLPPIETYEHTLTASARYTSFKQNVDEGAVDLPVTYMPFEVNYRGLELDSSGQTALNAGLKFNVRGVVSDEAEFANKRSGATPNFFVFKTGLKRTQILPLSWQLELALEGQLSGSPLIDTEQYLAGGADTVRGYLESELGGDKGVRTSLELHTPRLLSRVSSLDDFRALAFFDAAKLWSYNDDTKIPFIASAGFGVRIKAFKNFSADLDYAFALHSSAVLGGTKKDDSRAHVKLLYEF